MNRLGDFRPVVLPAWAWNALTPEQRASGYYIELEPLEPVPSMRPVRWLNRAARRAEARRARIDATRMPPPADSQVATSPSTVRRHL